MLQTISKRHKSMINESHKYLAGVYKIWHKSQPKYTYIGSTTVNLNRRFGRHLNELRNSIHTNKFLQNIYDKYGEHGLCCELLESSDSPAVSLRKIEQHYINKHIETFGRDTLINGSLDAACPLDDPNVQALKVARVKESYKKPETLLMAADRISKLRSNPETEAIRKQRLLETCAKKTAIRLNKEQQIKNEKHTAWLNSDYGQPVICIETGVTYTTAREAIKLFKTSASYTSIIRCCLGIREKFQGFTWMFADESKRTPRIKKSKKHYRAVICTSTGVIFDTMKDAVAWLRDTFPKANHQSLAGACKYSNSTAYGLTWEYLAGPKEKDKPKRPSNIKVTPEQIALNNEAFRNYMILRMQDPETRKKTNETMVAATRKAVTCIDNGMQFVSCSEAARWVKANTTFNASSSKISLACLGKRPIAYGLKWAYVPVTGKV